VTGEALYFREILGFFFRFVSASSRAKPNRTDGAPFFFAFFSRFLLRSRSAGAASITSMVGCGDSATSV
jgi:hypothetical protein